MSIFPSCLAGSQLITCLHLRSFLSCDILRLYSFSVPLILHRVVWSMESIPGYWRHKAGNTPDRVPTQRRAQLDTLSHYYRSAYNVCPRTRGGNRGTRRKPPTSEYTWTFCFIKESTLIVYICMFALSTVWFHLTASISTRNAAFAIDAKKILKKIRMMLMSAEFV